MPELGKRSRVKQAESDHLLSGYSEKLFIAEIDVNFENKMLFIPSG
jgi:hypothetical protein